MDSAFQTIQPFFELFHGKVPFDLLFSFLRNNVFALLWVLLVPLMLARVAQGRELIIGLFDDTDFFSGWRASVLILMFHLVALAIFFVPTAVFPDSYQHALESIRPVFGLHPYIVVSICLSPMLFYALATFRIQYAREPKFWKIIAVAVLLLGSVFLAGWSLHYWSFGLGTLALLTAANMVFTALLIMAIRAVEQRKQLGISLFWNYLAVGLGMAIQAPIIAGMFKTLDIAYHTPGQMYLYNAHYLALLGTVVLGMAILSLVAWNLKNLSPTFILMAIVLFYLMLGDLAIAGLVVMYQYNFWIWIGLVVLLLFIVYVIFLHRSKLHYVDLVEDTNTKYDKRATLDAYFEAWWVQHIEPQLARPTGSKIPIYLVAAQGGGSRAGFWVSQILNNLVNKQGEEFRNNLFAVTSASGGSAGFGSILSLWRYFDEHPEITPAQRATIRSVFAQGMFERNYLSGQLMQLMVNEVFKRFLLVFGKKRVNNRNHFHQIDEALGMADGVRLGWKTISQTKTGLFKQIIGRIRELSERGDSDTFEVAEGRKMDNYQRRPYLSFWYNKQDQINASLPLYFPISFNAQTGRAGFSSPVTMEHPVFVDALDIVQAADQPQNNQYIPLVGASNMSQLFPLMNAYTFVPGIGNFVDGGFFENQGFTLLSHLYAYLDQRLAAMPALVRDRIYIQVIETVNSAVVPETGSETFDKPLSQGKILTRAMSFAGIAGRTTFWRKSMDLRNNPQYPVQSYVLQYKTNKKEAVNAVPLGRWLSRRSVQRMVDRAKALVG